MKKLLKGFVVGVIYVLVLPGGLVSRLSHRLLRSTLLYEFFAQGYALVPGLPGRLTRACFYHQTLRRCHLDLDIGFASSISKIETSIGRAVLITGHTTIGYAEIGDGAVIANHVSILSGRYQHNFTEPGKDILAGSDQFSLVKIGAGSFIGENAVSSPRRAPTIVGAGASS